MGESMTPRERVQAALAGETPDRIPRTYAAVPGFDLNHPGALAKIEADYPKDADHCWFELPDGMTQGEPFEIGQYVDEWGCTFENVHAGVTGQVRDALLASYEDLDAKLQPPRAMLGHNLDAVRAACTASDQFLLTPRPVQPFERMQFLRGTEALLKDFVKKPDGLYMLRDRVHRFYLDWIEMWCALPVDGIFIADDWGTQVSLLVSPKFWRDFFKPMYAEYIERAHAAGKIVYMHSDGYIIDLLDDLIEIGLDAINAQVTCMNLAELSQRFTGRITFWGQMDRQQMLPQGSVTDAQQAVRDFYEFLATPKGSRVVCQMHIEPDARPENVSAVLSSFSEIRPGV
jgi:uroporphyrinogen decarboxylase